MVKYSKTYEYDEFVVKERSIPMEGEYTLNAANLVVAAQQVKLVRSEQFLREKVGDNLDAAGPAVHVVAEQQKRGGCQVDTHSPEHFLETREVRVVSVQVAWGPKRE